MDDQLLNKAINLIDDWHEAGCRLPGFNPKYKRRYIAYLLGIAELPSYNPSHSPTEGPGYNLMKEKLLNEYKHVLEALCSPHGYAYLKAMVAKKGLYDDHA